MTLTNACEIAEDCGLTTVGEAITNIEIHAPSFFDYDKLSDEIKELHNDAKNIDPYTLVKDYLRKGE